MEHTIKITELVKRPIIRNDSAEEFLNKMTDDEIKQWDIETSFMLLEKGVPKKFPDWNAAFLAKVIDTSIIYSILKENITNENNNSWFKSF